MYSLSSYTHQCNEGRKITKQYKIGTEEVKLFILADDMFVCRTSKRMYKQFDLLSEFSKVAGYTVNIPKKKKNCDDIDKQKEKLKKYHL